MSDWWSKKLSGEKPTPQRPVFTPPISPLTGLLKQPQSPVTPTNTLVNAGLPVGEQVDLGTAIRLWKGGEAHRKDGNTACPSCGGPYVFSRGASGTTVNGAAPAPRCYSCGWNGLYSQGEQSSWSV